MAGHSKFKNIMHRKGAQDKKRAKLFSRLIREITVAAKLGLPDPNSNPRLRSAVNNALAANMTRDSIDKAIKKQSDNSSKNQIEEIIYEGFGPGGAAILIEVYTDNKNRSASEIRTIFNKSNGNLGNSGSVKHLFQKVGVIMYPKSIDSFESLFEFSSTLSVLDLNENDGIYEIETSLQTFHDILENFEKKYDIPKSSSLEWKAKELIDINENDAEKLLNLIEKLEELDDVQNIFSNFDINEELMEKIS
ncbi:MAG: YebC/PmpR family DNA-binding transcriptional regulator [Rickettsiales bacterium]|nr:YebC/PmpR family DNA-binding transcriptional regulator [Rickettsiales bacterium]